MVQVLRVLKIHRSKTCMLIKINKKAPNLKELNSIVHLPSCNEYNLMLLDVIYNQWNKSCNKLSSTKNKFALYKYYSFPAKVLRASETLSGSADSTTYII